MKKGFTLIELLVVVLIIGILAAIAVPQYQKAVEKSRFTQAFTMLKSMLDANNIVNMQTGENAKDFDELPVQIPGENFSSSCGNENTKCLMDGEYMYWLSNTGLYQVRRYVGKDLTKRTWVLEGFIASNGTYKMTCIADNENSHKLCKSLGGALRSGTTNYYDLP